MYERTGPLENRPASMCGGGKTLAPFEEKTILELKSGNTPGTVINIVLSSVIKGNNKSVKPANNEFIQPMIRAKIAWGIGNTGFNAVCDFILGTQITVAAENVRVDAQYLVTNRFSEGKAFDCVTFHELPEFLVDVGLGYGCIGKNAQLTELVQLENPDDEVIIQIPDFATFWTVQPVGVAIAEARMFGFAENLFTQYLFSSGGGPDEFGVGQQIRVFNGARFLKVINKNAVGPLYAFVIFALAL